MAVGRVVINMQIILRKKKYTDADLTFNVDEGSTSTENYNETLDSATIRISHISEQLDLEPFDKVILHDEENRLEDKYMCIDTYTETMESLDPITYSYEISLFSETKELENTILPNLAITQLRYGTHRSVWYYLEQYLNLYDEKIRYRITIGGITHEQFANRHQYELGTVEDKFDSIDCPEMQWNNPTLREVLTDLMMVADCIPVVRNNEISFIDLTKKKTDISNNSHINYIQRSQSSEDYVSELRMNMVNVMQTSVTLPKQSVTRIEHLTFKSSEDGYVVTDSNLVLRTQFPILKINHLYIHFQAKVDKIYVSDDDPASSAIRTYRVDLCNLKLYNNVVKQLVYEYTEFNALDITRYNPTNFDNIVQNICLYYKRYSNIIEGFSQLSKKYWIFDDKMMTLTNLKTRIAEYCQDINGERPFPNNVNHTQFEEKNVWFSTFFDIEYETTQDAVFQAGKGLPTTHERVVADNQTYSFVDAYNQGFMEYQKVNRLGNQQLFINARYTDDFTNIIEIGDYYNDSVVYQTQYQIYKDHIEVNAVATKDYILRDYFTGVKAKIRAWKYAPADEAFIRHDLIKYYLEFSKVQKTEIGSSLPCSVRYFTTALYNEQPRFLKYAFVKTSAHPVGDTTSYTVDLLGRIMGNSIVFTFGFDDNFNVGKRVSSELQSANIRANYWSGINLELLHIYDNFTEQYGGVPLEDTQYVDNDGNFNDITFYLTNEIDDPDALHNYTSSVSDANDSSKFFLYRVSKLPEVENSLFEDYVKISGNKMIYKDNRETPKISLQFEFCSDTHDIVFTRRFLELQDCICEGKHHGLPNIKIYQDNKNNFDWRNPKLGNATLIDGSHVNVNYPVTTKYVELSITGTSDQENHVYYIVDAYNNDILLAVCGTNVFYLNFLISRDINIYNGNRVPVGTI